MVKVKDNKTGEIMTVSRDKLKNMTDITLLEGKENVNKMEKKTRRLEHEAKI
jgi:hypothetical protein